MRIVFNNISLMIKIAFSFYETKFLINIKKLILNNIKKEVLLYSYNIL